jgi:hypothetical protein
MLQFTPTPWRACNGVKNVDKILICHCEYAPTFIRTLWFYPYLATCGITFTWTRLLFSLLSLTCGAHVSVSSSTSHLLPSHQPSGIEFPRGGAWPSNGRSKGAPSPPSPRRHTTAASFLTTSPRKAHRMRSPWLPSSPRLCHGNNEDPHAHGNGLKSKSNSREIQLESSYRLIPSSPILIIWLTSKSILFIQ